MIHTLVKELEIPQTLHKFLGIWKNVFNMHSPIQIPSVIESSIKRIALIIQFIHIKLINHFNPTRLQKPADKYGMSLYPEMFR